MRARSTLSWLVPFVACGCAHLHTPAGPVVPDRPGFTDTPTVLPVGAVQVEGGFTDDRSSESRYQSIGEVLLRIGVPGPFELRLFANSFGVRTIADAEAAHGMEDFKVGAKFRLIARPDSVHGLTPSLALFVATTLPTGARNIGAGAAQPEAKLAAAWTTSSPFSFYTNTGFGAVYDGAAWSDHGWGSLATWYAATPRLSLFLEGNHVQNVSGPAASSSYVDGGFTLLFGDRLQVDARVGRGAGSPVTSERFVGLGLARRF
jgi:Putative MetA-pathway of phenol degradation